MSEPTPQELDDRPKRRLPSATFIRSALVVVALLGAWGVMVSNWTTSAEYRGEDPLFDAGRVAITAGLLVLTVLWVASIRFERLRAALVPIEAGLVAGIAIVLVGARGVEVDTNEDVAAIAVLVGIGTTIVVGVAARLLDGRRSAPWWITAVVVAAIVLGAGLPAIADRITETDESMSVYTSPDGGVLARLTTDGAVSLTMPFQTIGLVDGSYDSSPSIYAGVPVDPSGAPVPAAAITDPIAGTDAVAVAAMPPTTSVQAGLVVLPNGGVEVRAASLAASNDVPVEAVVREGSCTRSGVVVDTWTTTNPASAMRHRIAGLDLDDLAELHLVTGTGRPLAPVRCMDLVDRAGLNLARNGGAEFGRRCIAPLRLDQPAKSALTPASFQDPTCATDLERLTTILQGQWVSPDRAAAARACVIASGADVDFVDLDDGGLVVRVSMEVEDADASLAASTCLIDGGSGQPAPSSPEDIASDLNGETPEEVLEKLR